ncbi:hypothetical protein R6Q57_002513 [Mikania cordata]
MGTNEELQSYRERKHNNDPFLVVMNIENYGYRRLFGRGVTNTLIKKSRGSFYIIHDYKGIMESFKANVDVKKNNCSKYARRLKMTMREKRPSLKSCVQILTTNDKT